MLNAQQSPVNDDLCNAMPISVGAACNGVPNIDTDLATAQPDEPVFQCPGSSSDTIVYNSVWYSFTAPAGPVYILAAPDDNSIPSLSYQMNLFTMDGDCSSLSSLEPVDCNTPQVNLQTAPALLATLEEGQAYYLQISGRKLSGDPNPFSSTGCLSITKVETPANDDACDAISLELNADPQVFNNLGATAQPGEAAIAPPPGTGGALAVNDDGWALGGTFIDHSVWFSFTAPPGGGNFTIDLTGSFGIPGDFNTQLAVYEAADCNDFSTYTLVGAAATTFVVATGLNSINQAAIDNSGTLYALTDGQEMYSASLDGSPATLVGPFTANPLAVRGLEIDPTDDKMYFTARTVNGPSPTATYTWQSMNEVDKATGEQVRFIRDLSSSATTLAFAIQERTVAPYQYAWAPAAGLDDPNSPTPVFTVEETTTFTLAVSDACGQSEDLVTVSRLPDAMTDIDTMLNMGDTYNGIVIGADTSITEIFTAANGCDSIVTTNIMVIINSVDERWGDEAIRLSPNPASATLTVITEGVREGRAQIFVRDLNGRPLLSIPLRDDKQALDVSALPAGQYLLEIRSAQGFAVRRFVKM